MHKVILMVGVPCSGKSWVAKNARGVKYIPHDLYNRHDYYQELVKATLGNRIVLAEAPFNAQELVDRLERTGVKVEQWLVTASLETLVKRYFAREGKLYPKQFITNRERYETCRGRFSFAGTSDQVLMRLHG